MYNMRSKNSFAKTNDKRKGIQQFHFLQSDICMDDIYFSDKKRKRQPERPAQKDVPSAPKNSDGESFELSFRQQGNGQTFSQQSKPFSVNIPQETPKAAARQESRVPQGRVAPQESRVPQGRVAPQNGGTPQRQSSAAKKPSPSGTAPRSADPRTPQGRVASQSAKKASSSKGKTHKTGTHHKPPQKKSPAGKIAVGIACLFVILFAALFFYGYSALGGLSYTELEDENAYISESELVSDSDVRNILFIGSDEREGLGGQRSDSMILFSIDNNNKKIKLTSFMRDSYVYIPSKGYKTKLNAAFNYGGAQLLIDTLEYNFHVKIDDYVMVDYDVFIDFVNLLGGVTIDGVTEAEAKYMREQVNRPNFKEGTNTMDGRTAMWYCRIRYVDDDFHRTQRQRKVLTALINTAAKTNLFKLIDIVKQVLPNISTNMEKNDLLSLGIGAFVKYLRYDIVQQQIPAPKTWENRRINGKDVLVMNMEKNIEILEEFIYGNATEESE